MEQLIQIATFFITLLAPFWLGYTFVIGILDSYMDEQFHPKVHYFIFIIVVLFLWPLLYYAPIIVLFQLFPSIIISSFIKLLVHVANLLVWYYILRKFKKKQSDLHDERLVKESQVLDDFVE